MGIDIHCNQSLGTLTPDGAVLKCMFTGRGTEIKCGATVLVTERHRRTELYNDLKPLNLKSLELIGDAAQPGLIVDAVFSGHRAARNFERPADDADKDWFRREIIDLEDA